MAFSAFRKRKPFAVFLVALALCALLFACAYLIRPLHHHHFFDRFIMHTTDKQKAAAGIDSVALGSDRMAFAGWAPARAAVTISDQGRQLANSIAADTGKWDAGAALSKHSGYQSLLVTYQENNKDAVKLAHVGLFMPGKSTDDATIWVKGAGAAQLMQVPDPSGDNDLYLVLAYVRDGKPVALSGRGVAGSLIQAYADNDLIGTAFVGDDGFWALTSVLDASRKVSALRLDEVKDAVGVVERRSYHPAWADVKPGDVGSVQGMKDGSFTTDAEDDGGKVLIAVFKPDAGTSDPVDEELPGQIIPLIPQAAGK